MPADEFTWKREAGAQGKVKFRNRTAQFGEGLRQVVGDGLNPKNQDWPLSFSGDLAYITPIVDFIDLRAGRTAFTWTPPASTQKWFTCDEYNLISIGAGVYQITMEFKQFNKL